MTYEFNGQTFNGFPRKIDELIMNDENILDHHLSKAFFVEDERDRSIEMQAILKDKYVEELVNGIRSKTEITLKAKLSTGAMFNGQTFLESVSVEPTGLVDSKYVNAVFVISNGELSKFPKSEMSADELIDRIKRNALGLGLAASNSLDVNPDHMKGINIAIKKIFEGTGITTESLIEENKTNDWFKGK